jgi:hypothetical protein
VAAAQKPSQEEVLPTRSAFYLAFLGASKCLVRQRDCGLVFTAEIKSQYHLVQTSRQIGVAGIEPDACFEICKPFPIATGKYEARPGGSRRNSPSPSRSGPKFRIGINLGDVIVEEHDIFGDGANVAGG